MCINQSLVQLLGDGEKGKKMQRKKAKIVKKQFIKWGILKISQFQSKLFIESANLQMNKVTAHFRTTFTPLFTQVSKFKCCKSIFNLTEIAFFLISSLKNFVSLYFWHYILPKLIYLQSFLTWINFATLFNISQQLCLE